MFRINAYSLLIFILLWVY